MLNNNFITKVMSCIYYVSTEEHIKGTFLKSGKDLRSEEQWQSFYCVGIQKNFRMLLQEMTRKVFGNSKMWLEIESLPKNQLCLSFISWWLLKKNPHFIVLYCHLWRMGNNIPYVYTYPGMVFNITIIKKKRIVFK